MMEEGGEERKEGRRKGCGRKWKERMNEGRKRKLGMKDGRMGEGIIGKGWINLGKEN